MEPDIERRALCDPEGVSHASRTLAVGSVDSCPHVRRVNQFVVQVCTNPVHGEPLTDEEVLARC
jgi:hypothetical protein